jgi:arginase family enzyme
MFEVTRHPQQKEKIKKVFGVPFDPANSPERLNLKLAYLSHVMKGAHPSETFDDPYDAIKGYAIKETPCLCEDIWLGKMPVESWLRPRPKPKDMSLLTPSRARSFLENNGCWDCALRVKAFVEESVFPHVPVMIGVDHSLTGGVLMALAKRYSPLNVVILDAHFDVMNPNSVTTGFETSQSQTKQTFYQCGNFLSILLDKGIIQPENLWVLGVVEAASAMNNPLRGGKSPPGPEGEIRKWIDKGVNLVPREMISSGDVDINLSGPTYVSIDMDVGSLTSVFAARFMNCQGLGLQEFLDMLSLVQRSIQYPGAFLVGFDIMEIDIHFLEAVEEMPHKDYTKSRAGVVLGRLLWAG